MGVKESLGKAMMDKRTLIAILVIAILWRIGISWDGRIALWESVCSGIAIIVMGWALFAYVFLLAKELKGWLELNRIYHWISNSILSVNLFVIVYYAERWYRLATMPEYVLPLDYAREICNAGSVLLCGDLVRWIAEEGAGGLYIAI